MHVEAQGHGGSGCQPLFRGSVNSKLTFQLAEASGAATVRFLTSSSPLEQPPGSVSTGPTAPRPIRLLQKTTGKASFVLATPTATVQMSSWALTHRGSECIVERARR